jgi:hypothetical protein
VSPALLPPLPFSCLCSPAPLLLLLLLLLLLFLLSCMSTQWIVLPRPEGVRCLVMSCGGVTISRKRNGAIMHRFPSALPSGSRSTNQGKQGICLLDCVYQHQIKTYFVLDLMCWKGYALYDSTAEFRYMSAQDTRHFTCLGVILLPSLPLPLPLPLSLSPTPLSLKENNPRVWGRGRGRLWLCLCRRSRRFWIDSKIAETTVGHPSSFNRFPFVRLVSLSTAVFPGRSPRPCERECACVWPGERFVRPPFSPSAFSSLCCIHGK